MNVHAQQIAQIEHAVITIAQIMPAAQQGRSANIKDTDGIKYGIWPNMLGNAQAGGSYEIDFTSTVKNGVTFRDIKGMRMAERPSPPPAQFTAAQPQPPARQTGAKESGGGYYRPTSPRDARRMFLCSTLNAFIQTGRIDLHREHLKQAIGEITAAYDATIGLEDKE